MVVSPVHHLSLFGSSTAASEAMTRLREAQSRWAAEALHRRLSVVHKFRRLLVEHEKQIVESVQGSARSLTAETLCAEVLPIAEACRFLERRAARVLRRRRFGSRRPRWLGGVRIEVERAPHGLVLIIGAGNYPLLLPGVQALQALVAGNGVLLKPAPGGGLAAQQLADLLLAAGLPEDLLVLLDPAPETAQQVIEQGVDKVLFTGSSATGRKVLHQLAEQLTPATLELSGCDAVFVHPTADLQLVTAALTFGLTFNTGASCISPRRVFVTREQSSELEALLAARLAQAPRSGLEPATAARLQNLTQQAIRGGARLITAEQPGVDPHPPVVLAGVRSGMDLARADILAPVVSLIEVDDMDEALRLDAECPYALGATVFGTPDAANRLARRIQAGVVIVNDMIVPTADPRVPFGGRGESGFGVTRGAEGLLELTQPRVLISRGGSWRPHFEPLEPGDEAIFSGMLRAKHGSPPWLRLAGWFETLRALRGKARRSAGK